MVFCVFWHAASCLVFLFPGILCLVIDKTKGLSPYEGQIESLKVFGNGLYVTLTLKTSNSFKYLPGQYIFLNIPKLSELQYHPFSVSSSRDIKIYVNVMPEGFTDELSTFSLEKGFASKVHMGFLHASLDVIQLFLSQEVLESPQSQAS